MEGPALRKFLVDAEDVQGLRAFDNGRMKETDLGTGGAK